MRWTRHALLALRSWWSLRQVYERYLESPGTKAYSVSEVRQLFSTFREIQVRIVLTHGDLLASDVG